jgi:hypothetical protein
VQYMEDGTVTWRGCPFVPYGKLTRVQQEQARRRFSPEGRQGVWREIEHWAFALRSNGTLAKCPYIEPVYTLTHSKEA